MSWPRAVILRKGKKVRVNVLSVNWDDRTISFEDRTVMEHGLDYQGFYRDNTAFENVVSVNSEAAAWHKIDFATVYWLDLKSGIARKGTYEEFVQSRADESDKHQEQA